MWGPAPPHYLPEYQGPAPLVIRHIRYSLQILMIINSSLRPASWFYPQQSTCQPHFHTPLTNQSHFVSSFLLITLATYVKGRTSLEFLRHTSTASKEEAQSKLQKKNSFLLPSKINYNNIYIYVYIYRKKKYIYTYLHVYAKHSPVKNTTCPQIPVRSGPPFCNRDRERCTALQKTNYRAALVLPEALIDVSD